MRTITDLFNKNLKLGTALAMVFGARISSNKDDDSSTVQKITDAGLYTGLVGAGFLLLDRVLNRS